MTCVQITCNQDPLHRHFIMANLEDPPAHTKVSTGICSAHLAGNEHKVQFHLDAIISTAL